MTDDSITLKTEKEPQLVGDINGYFSEMIERVQMFKIHVQELQTYIKKVEKDTLREVKQLQKQLNKKLPKSPRKPSGFAQPTKISTGLCEFLEKPEGTQMARTAVTKELIKYIKDKELQSDKNKKIIIPDTKLLKLLDLKENEQLNYFNLQSYMNKHFVSK